MTLRFSDSPEDLLDQASHAMREQAIPEGPSPFLIERTRASLRRRPGGASSRIMRWAAIVLITGSAIATAWVINNRSAAQLATKANTPTGKNNNIAPALPVMLAGRVILDGPPPVPQLLPPMGGPNCGHNHPPPKDESIVVGAGGGLANVVVAISAGLPEGKAFPKPAAIPSLDQKDCRYVPRVVAMQVGQELVAKNSDPFFHNVHTNSLMNKPVNFAQPQVDPVGLKLKTIKAAETFKVTCDLHPWMIAWVAAFDHPYFAVTHADGSFEMPALEPGHYTLRAWHERLGSVEQQFTIGPDGKASPVKLTFGAERLAAAMSDQVPTASAEIRPCCRK